MKLRHGFSAALDRPGCRKILALFATRIARRRTSLDVSIFFDDLWIYRINSAFIPGTERITFRNTREWESALNFLGDSRDYWFHIYKPKPGDVIVDIGAGFGADTLLFSRSVGKNGRVIAIEAHPLEFLRLKKLCKWNLPYNATAYQYAIIDQRCTCYIEDGPQMAFNRVSYTKGGAFRQIQVQGIQLDELCQEQGIDHIDFLKMNIEGAERFAINGAKNIIKKTQYVCIACHDFMSCGSNDFRTKDIVIDFLQHNNFNVFLRDKDPRDYVRDHVHGIRKTSL